MRPIGLRSAITPGLHPDYTQLTPFYNNLVCLQPVLISHLGFTMSFLSILEGEFNVVRNHTQRPCRLSPIELEAARRFILMTKLDVPTFNFYSAGSVLSWCGEKHPASEAMADIQMILDRILVPLGYSLTGDMFAYDNNSFSIARIFVENDVVRLCLCQCVCLLFLLSACCPFLKSFRCFTSMSHTQVCIANMHDILAERERGRLP